MAYEVVRNISPQQILIIVWTFLVFTSGMKAQMYSFWILRKKVISKSIGSVGLWLLGCALGPFTSNITFSHANGWTLLNIFQKTEWGNIFQLILWCQHHPNTKTKDITGKENYKHLMNIDTKIYYKILTHPTNIKRITPCD